MSPRCQLVGSVVAFAVLTLARADAQDQPAAVVVYPYVTVDTSTGVDTVVQLTNVSDQAVAARCFYESFGLECIPGTAGETCGPGPITCLGTCTETGSRTPFLVRLTARQPVTWRLSQGLNNAPLDGVDRIGPDGVSNQGTDVPALNTKPLTGTLRCVVAGTDEYLPGRDDALVGLATIEERPQPGVQDAMQYRALGFRAAEGGSGPNRDEFLQLGGENGEYEPCPAILMLEHFFDGGPVSFGDQTAHAEPAVALTTCTSPFDQPGNTVAQFFVYNEFDQRFSTSNSIRGQRVGRLAMIDTTDPKRSIFAVGVSGTLAGHTIIRPVGSGLHAIGIERFRYADDHVRSAAFNVHAQSVRSEPDDIAFRAPLCPGDCNQNGAVTVNELVSGVNIALERLALASCDLMDTNRDAAVAVNELVQATNAALHGCPPSVLPTPGPALEEAQGAPVAVGPEITVLGLATADDQPLPLNRVDNEGRPVFSRPFGQGMTIVVEARGNPRQIGRNTYTPGSMPDLQLLVSNPLGDGGAEVCENDGRRGGIPGNAQLDFTAPDAVDAVNDLGCRAFDRQGSPANAFTRQLGSDEVWAFSDSRSQIQFGVPIAKAWAFPVGDTIVAARVRDVTGELSPVREIVVHVAEP